MAKSEPKTTVSDADVDMFIDAVADEMQRSDARTIVQLMQRLSDHPPRMWGPSIIGFGKCHYKYESGREGDMPRIAFSPRKGKTVLYIADGYERFADLMERLGKHKTGRACLYIKRLSDIDGDILEQLCMRSLAEMADRYPE